MVKISEKRLLSIAEYLVAEDAAEARNEFQNGKTIEMAGGTLSHNVVKGEIFTLINMAIKAADIPHLVLNSDTKVRIESDNRFFYPDVTISDGTPVYYPPPEGRPRRDIIINPLVIVEVLSEDTRYYDKGEKFDMYCSVPGFQEYILIEPEQVWVKSMFLQDPAEHLWKHEVLTDKSARLPIRSLGWEIPLADLYTALEKLPKEEEEKDVEQ
ncbi:MAG TPA: Uma2 family endonuclease [Saprospiraceae bacterium]|nr:Uma2 family endonuclease [Saprospiraceae bacterium]